MKKALIVDDAEPNRVLIGVIVKRFGLEVEYAEDGDEAVQKFVVMNPDIVFIDQIMPRKNGSEAVKEMKHIRPDFIAIIMSALTGEDDIKAIMEYCGAEEFQPKPISVPIIANILKKYHIVE